MVKDKMCLKMIKGLSEAKGPSGFEDETIAAAREYTKEFDVREDCVRNFYITSKKNTGNKPVFMLDAHSDEIGFMIHSIRPNGTLRFAALGGWNLNALPSSKVRVRNAEGNWVSGVITAKPVHFMTPEEKKKSNSFEICSLSIDVGARSMKEAEQAFKIRIGEPVVSDVQFEYNEEQDIMMGKGFDCRIGCAALIETMKRLEKETLSVDVKGVLSAQEELGERGVRVAVNQIKPDIAICFEGCPADDTFTEDYAVQTGFKKGPMLRFMDNSVICSPRYQRFALNLAEKMGIAVQASVREGGGNNGAVINTALSGIPVIVIGVPVRYIHSHYGITSYYDFEQSVQLAAAIIKEMNREYINKF